MAKLSLQEQLLKSGLIGSGQARTVKSEKHKQAKQQQHNKTTTIDAVKEQAQKIRLEQEARDRELNQLRKQDEERKQIGAQVKQLIEQNRLPKDNGEASLAYHFTDGNKVKVLYVSKTVREQLTRGHLAIVRLGKQYEIVSAEVVAKIKLRDGAGIIVFNESMPLAENQEDLYADYQVPDDLMW
ncbi:DUF2058 domain-containing protein [Methyloglobulus sp.]|uniref:DUF2058 domain-containing protein n=1 Tax=Methyloglobulus sp. TaxID=2518622 RepID=UPI0032B7C34B